MIKLTFMELPAINTQTTLAKLALTHPLTLCVAPAGYGKTHFVGTLSGLYQQQGSVLTVTLTRPCYTPSEFIHTISCQLAELSSEETNLLESIAAVLSNNQTLLAIDAFELANTPEICHCLEQLVRQTSSQCRFVLCSRTELTHPFHDFLLNGKALLIRARDLVFDFSESQNFLLHTVERLELNDQLIQQVHSMTEGWPLAVKLCAQLFNQTKDTKFLALINNGQLKILNDYFQKNLVDALPEHSLHFLRIVANFDSFNESLSSYLYNESDVQDILSNLCNQNSFIEVKEAPTYEYRLHPLFRSFLLNQQEAPTKPEVKQLLLKAVDWAKANHAPILAIDCAVKSKDFTLATHLLNDSVEAFIRDQGMLPKLLSWCRHIPLENTRASIHLHFWLAWAFTFSCLLDQAQRSIEQLNRLLASDKTLASSEKYHFEGRIRSISLALAIFQDKSEWTFEQTELWLEQFKQTADPFDTAVVAGGRFLSARLQLRVSAAKNAISLAKEAIVRADSFYGRMWIDALDGLSEMEFGDQRVASKLLRVSGISG